MQVNLRPIDRSNWYACVKLCVSPDQQGFVASNAFSLAQAAYEPETYPLGIYHDGELKGFAMYSYDQDMGMWGMCRLMVDFRFQHQGIGQASLRALLALVTERHGHVPFYTSAEPGNEDAIAMYEKMGFQRNGRIIEDEVMLEIKL